MKTLISCVILHKNQWNLMGLICVIHSNGPLSRVMNETYQECYSWLLIMIVGLQLCITLPLYYNMILCKTILSQFLDLFSRRSFFICTICQCWSYVLIFFNEHSQYFDQTKMIIDVTSMGWQCHHIIRVGLWPLQFYGHWSVINNNSLLITPHLIPILFYCQWSCPMTLFKSHLKGLCHFKSKFNNHKVHTDYLKFIPFSIAFNVV